MQYLANANYLHGSKSFDYILRTPENYKKNHNCTSKTACKSRSSINSKIKKDFLFLSRIVFIFLLLLSVFFADKALIAAEKNGLHIDITGDGTSLSSGGLTSRIIQMFGLITVLSVAPSIVMMVTSFTRITVVFSILRNAIGLQQTPPNSVTTGLALFLTLFIMQPSMEKAYDNGIKPLIESQISEEDAWHYIIEPFRAFMIKNTPAKEVNLFADMAKLTVNAENPPPMHCLVPAFMISELKKAFQIGFLLFLPFLVIDMLVASILMSVGMMMLPPAMVSLPIKIIFFVMVDGWYLLCGSLAKGYGL